MRHGGSYIVDEKTGKPKLAEWTKSQAEAGDDTLAAKTVAQREKDAAAARSAEKKAAQAREAALPTAGAKEGSGDAPKAASKPIQSGSKAK